MKRILVITIMYNDEPEYKVRSIVVIPACSYNKFCVILTRSCEKIRDGFPFSFLPYNKFVYLCLFRI